MRKILLGAAAAVVALVPATAAQAKVVITAKTTPVSVHMCKVVLASKSGAYLRRNGKTVPAFVHDGKRHRKLCVDRHWRTKYPGGKKSNPDVKKLAPGGYIDTTWGDGVAEARDGDHFAFVANGNRGVVGEHYISDRWPGTLDENIFYSSRNRWNGADIVCEYNDQIIGDNTASFAVMVEPYCYSTLNGGVLATPNVEFNYGFGAGNFEDLEDQN